VQTEQRKKRLRECYSSTQRYRYSIKAQYFHHAVYHCVGKPPFLTQVHGHYGIVFHVFKYWYIFAYQFMITHAHERAFILDWLIDCFLCLCRVWHCAVRIGVVEAPLAKNARRACA